LATVKLIGAMPDGTSNSKKYPMADSSGVIEERLYV